MQAETRTFLQVADHAKKVLGLRIAARAEHPDQALGRCTGCFAELFETDGRLDVIAQDRLAGIDIAAQHCIDALAKKGLGKYLVGLGPILHQAVKLFVFAIVRLRLASHALAPFVVLPVGTRRIDIALLPLLGSARQQDDDRLAIPPEIDPIAGTKLDPIFRYTFANAFDVGEIALLHADERTGDLGADCRFQFREPFGEGLTDGPPLTEASRYFRYPLCGRFFDILDLSAVLDYEGELPHPAGDQRQ
jgi:hypothetical protein